MLLTRSLKAGLQNHAWSMLQAHKDTVIPSVTLLIFLVAFGFGTENNSKYILFLSKILLILVTRGINKQIKSIHQLVALILYFLLGLTIFQ